MGSQTLPLLLAAEGGSWLGGAVLVGILAVVMIGSGLLVIGIARRAADGRTGRNPVAGIRTKATMSSDEAWDAAHAAGLQLTVIGGWAAVLSGLASIPVALLFWQQGVSAEAGSGMAIMVSAGLGSAGLVGFVIAGAVKGHRAAVEVRDRIGSH